jgi:excisionase family DNA binding protein
MNNQNIVNDRWLSVEEIAGYLGVKKETIYKWLSQKRIPAHKLGRLWKFKKDEIDKWVTTGGAGKKEKPIE